MSELTIIEQQKVLNNDLKCNEVWKSVLGYEGLYEVSNFGNVITKQRYVNGPRGLAKRKEHILKSFKSNSGYLRVSLYKNGLEKHFSIHRLVAIAFIPNPENKLEINHINGVKDDNRICNLEWVTKSENEKHAYKTALKRPSCGMKGFSGEKNKQSKIIIQCDIHGNEINRFFGSAEASRMTNSEQSSIIRCANGKIKTHHGYIWRYA